MESKTIKFPSNCLTCFKPTIGIIGNRGMQGKYCCMDCKPGVWSELSITNLVDGYEAGKSYITLGAELGRTPNAVERRLREIKWRINRLAIRKNGGMQPETLQRRMAL